MPATLEILTDASNDSKARETFALDVLIGLTEIPKKISSKYFYDERGSTLFKQIMELPEYYLTCCETEIFARYNGSIAGQLQDTSFNLIELGPGDARKTRILLESFTKKRLQFRYIPIDISESAMKQLVDDLHNNYSNLDVFGLVSDYLEALSWLKRFQNNRSLVLLLGSNIGNFNRAKARVFLRSLWNSLHNDDLLLIGFDLKKDIDLLHRAYNDSAGVTAAFNYNLLQRINTELGGDFDLAKFRHYGTYNVFSGAMESYLVSLEKQTVFIRELGQAFTFDPWEPIHTEYSYKYLESDIVKLAEDTGYSVEEQFYDSKGYFTDCIWRVKKQNGVTIAS